jgi:hypothetical protein
VNIAVKRTRGGRKLKSRVRSRTSATRRRKNATSPGSTPKTRSTAPDPAECVELRELEIHGNREVGEPPKHSTEIGR